jgi:hypothetical protein
LTSIKFGYNLKKWKITILSLIIKINKLINAQLRKLNESRKS